MKSSFDLSSSRRKDINFADFQKIGRRKELATARISMAFMARQDTDRKISFLRFALGACTSTPQRMEFIEDYLVGKVPTVQMLWEAGGMLAERVLELTGRRASAIYKEPAVTGTFGQDALSSAAGGGIVMDNACKFIGKNIIRSGAIEKLTGEAVFSADVELDSPLVLKALRSGRAHAEVVGIDPAKALEVEGVVAVFTAKDIPGKNLTGIINKDQPVLASDKVRSVADAVALVAADTEEAAEQGTERYRGYLPGPAGCFRS